VYAFTDYISILWPNFQLRRLLPSTLGMKDTMNIVKKGRYIFEVGKMHNKHGLSLLPAWPQERWSTTAANYQAILGPIVRIGPNELHVLDPDYHEILYSMKNIKLTRTTISIRCWAGPKRPSPQSKPTSTVCGEVL
jgi:hypothetical protein